MSFWQEVLSLMPRDQKDANITTVGDELWSGMPTVTTVGYGHRYPVTDVGRIVVAEVLPQVASV